MKRFRLFILNDQILKTKGDIRLQTCVEFNRLLNFLFTQKAVLHLKTLWTQVLAKAKNFDKCCCDSDIRTATWKAPLAAKRVLRLSEMHARKI